MAVVSEGPIVACPNCGTNNRVKLSEAAGRQPVCGRCRTPLPVPSADGRSGASGGGHPVEVSDATFEQFLAAAGDKPVLIDCWATWCPPCKALAPTIDALARESAGRWIIGKLDTDQNPQTAGRFRISSIPTMLIFQRSQLVDQLIGLQPKQAIEAALRRHG
jgi:thioredoxin